MFAANVIQKKHKMKKSPAERVGMAVVYFICILAGVLTITPFLYVLAGSFATERELVERSFFIIPHTFSLNAYKYIVNDGSIFRGLGNSFLIMIVGTVINMLFTTTLAYPLSKHNLRGRNLVLNMVIVTMLFSGGMIPNYLVVKGLHMLDSYLALMIPGAINAFNLIIVKNFFQELPGELEEAAKIDGCSDIGIFCKIVLPLSKPALASVGLFYAVSHWNDFFNSLIYLNSTEKFPVQIILRQIVLLAQGVSADGSSLDFGANGTPPEQAVRMAATVVATIPILVVYPFVQKYFEQGVMVGAVKG
ncbi:MAG TPA: carbohydrate ABC transporter permease [Candidatus Hungatella pullicola]|nr:carbohydrate ABC transporter permease [Candidatus Hungatella pullicola]